MTMMCGNFLANSLDKTYQTCYTIQTSCGWHCNERCKPFLPPSHRCRGINQTGTGTPHDKDTRALNTLFGDRGSPTLAELIETDLENIRQIFREEFREELAKPIIAPIDTSLGEIEATVDEIDMTFDSIHRSLDQIQMRRWMAIVLGGLRGV